jgi:hypothetical protein
MNKKNTKGFDFIQERGKQKLKTSFECTELPDAKIRQIQKERRVNE